MSIFFPLCSSNPPFPSMMVDESGKVARWLPIIRNSNQLLAHFSPFRPTQQKFRLQKFFLVSPVLISLFFVACLSSEEYNRRGCLLCQFLRVERGWRKLTYSIVQLWQIDWIMGKWFRIGKLSNFESWLAHLLSLRQRFLLEISGMTDAGKKQGKSLDFLSKFAMIAY